MMYQFLANNRDEFICLMAVFSKSAKQAVVQAATRG